MTHPRVVNVRTSKCDVYVGRGQGWSPATGQLNNEGWGNPFPVKQHGKAAMRLYLDHLAEHPELVERARAELPGKTLGCWCAPRICHGEVLARLADGEDLDAIRAEVLERVAETGELFA